MLDHKAGGRLEVTLSDPAALPAPGTGLLALELARRLAGLVGSELLAPEPNRIVIAWPAGAWSVVQRADGPIAARADSVRPGT